MELKDLVACPPGTEDLLCVSLRYSLLDVGRVPKGRLRELGENLVAALVRLETSSPGPSLWREVEAIRPWLPEHLAPSFDSWLRATLQSQGAEMQGQEGFFKRTGTMLAETIGEWKQELEQKGRVKGRAEGQAAVLLRQAQRRFGTLDEVTRRRIETADEETLLRCADRILTAHCVSDLF